MKQLPLLALVIVGILLVSSFTAIAAKPETPPGQLKEKNQKNEEAPGQWKKNQSDVNKSEFKEYVHMRIWNRLQVFGVSPPGLMKLLNIILDMVEEDSTEPPEEPEEPPEEEMPEEEPEDPPEEPPPESPET
jgi:hypothetical protein